MHVFARNIDDFYRLYHTDMAHWLAMSVNFGRLPVSALPMPNLCQLPASVVAG
jgi:hypothetical protein